MQSLSMATPPCGGATVFTNTLFTCKHVYTVSIRNEYSFIYVYVFNLYTFNFKKYWLSIEYWLKWFKT